MGASHSGMLYVVGTPIGNLGDLTARAAETFRAADVICCEDTRVTSKLLSHLGISKPLLRCDDNVIARRAPELVERVLAGERIAFASDAGMPSVSDPGQVLVELARNAGRRVEVIPGPYGLHHRARWRPEYPASISSSRAFCRAGTASACAVCDGSPAFPARSLLRDARIAS